MGAVKAFLSYFSVFALTESEFIAATMEGLVRRDKEGVGLFGKRLLWSKQETHNRSTNSAHSQ